MKLCWDFVLFWQRSDLFFSGFNVSSNISVLKARISASLLVQDLEILGLVLNCWCIISMS